jgi:4-hydroxybutyryl-CoA dehydratase/vinylacetyl-CoA-Delta-isomerase
MLTGEQYKDTLDDGRATYFEGERVKDLPGHPVLGQVVQNVADGYDWLAARAVDGVSPLSGVPRTADELRHKVELVHTAGMMAHVNYTSIMTLATAAGRLSTTAPQYVDRINDFVASAQQHDIRVTQCITDAKGDRSLPPTRQDDPDAYVRVVDRSPDGVVIRGAKLHISAAALGHDLMVMPTKNMKPGEEDWAICAAVPVNAPGVHITNTSYHPYGRDERDHPTSSRESVPDSMCIFDDVFVPNERIFLDGQAEQAAVFAHSLGLWERLGGTAFMVEQADELVGLAQLIAEANGAAKISHIREKIDEMMIHATLLRAGLEAALLHAHSTPQGYFYPDDMYTNVTKFQGAAQFSKMVRHLHEIAGGAVLTAPSMADFDNETLRPYLEKYMSTGNDVSGEYRTKLFHAIRDTTADAYGGWHHVTNIQSGGGLFAQRLVTRRNYDMDRARHLALKAAGLAGD